MAGATAVDCILLAAGASARMGQPKLLLPLGNATILDVVLASHLASSLGRICAVVPGWLAGFRDLAVKAKGGRLELVEMREPGPMSASLKAGWEWVVRTGKPDGIMISLADKPLVTAATIDSMIEFYGSAGGAICVPAYHGRRGHPVILSPRLGPEIMALEGDRGAIDIMTADPGRVVEIEVASDGVILDVDTAEDVAALRARLGLNG